VNEIQVGVSRARERERERRERERKREMLYLEMNENTIVIISPLALTHSPKRMVPLRARRTCRISFSFALAPALGALDSDAGSDVEPVEHLSLRLDENQIKRSTTFDECRSPAKRKPAETSEKSADIHVTP